MAEPAVGAAPAPVSQVYTWEPSNAAIAARYGLRPEDILRFDLNTSPVAPGLVAEALAGPFEPPLHEYPDSSYADLAAAAAGYVDAEPSELVVGVGADEVLDIIAKAYLRQDDRALLPLPTYSMYGVLSSQRGARLEPVLRLGPADGFALDLDALLPRLEGAAVLWLCDPNNPTGASERQDVLEQVLDAAHALGERGPLVVVDEAYVEFHARTLIPLRHRYPRLVVVRTISKAFGLAGVRVGYAVASRATIERLEMRRPPGSVPTISAHVAALALRRPEVARENAARLSEERDWLAAALRDMGLVPYPSVTNFLLVPMGGVEAAEDATEWLLRRGIVTRTFGPANPAAGHLRFTVRSRAENERFLEVLRAWTERRTA
jgi:histidinol-phosphate aminotransferase